MKAKILFLITLLLCVTSTKSQAPNPIPLHFSLSWSDGDLVKDATIVVRNSKGTIMPSVTGLAYDRAAFLLPSASDFYTATITAPESANEPSAHFLLPFSISSPVKVEVSVVFNAKGQSAGSSGKFDIYTSGRF